jgi:hypothetical protein
MSRCNSVFHASMLPYRRRFSREGVLEEATSLVVIPPFFKGNDETLLFSVANKQ